MKILNITAKKQKLGYEDLVIGTGHLSQERNGSTKKFYHKINIQCNMGLLYNCDFSTISSDLQEIYFSGFYEEGDLGEGLYRLVGDGSHHNIGIHISNGSVFWQRVFTQFVRPEWFGAHGDGITDDAEAFIIALNFGNVELREDAHYRLEMLKTNYLDINTNIDIIGNNATVEINSILDTNKLVFNLKDGSNVRIKFVNFKSNLKKLFQYFNAGNVDIKYCTFTPESVNPFEMSNYLTQQGEQYLNARVLEGKQDKYQVASNNMHPISRNDIKSLNLEKVDGAVTINDEQTIEGLKIFYKAPKGERAVDDDQVVTLAQMYELIVLPQSTKDTIDAWLQGLKDNQGSYGLNECVYPISSVYIQPHGTKEPSELWPGTKWVKLHYNDGAIVTQQIPGDTLTGKESINK